MVSIVRNVSYLREAVRALEEAGQQFVDEAYVEHYPGKYFGHQYRDPNIFCYQFFNREGRNIAVYIPDVWSVQIFGEPGRIYGVPGQADIINIANFRSPACSPTG